MLAVRRIVGNSVAPMLAPGAIVVAKKGSRRLALYDVIVFQHQGMDKIKRIIYMDGQNVFVEGDNNRLSTDSRHFGPIDRGLIIGKVIWPRI